jgi:hypothetical protein
MWITIDKETYMQKVKGLRPIESCTDPDGTMQFSCGRPQIVTVWGVVGANSEDNTPVVKCEQRKEDRHQVEWETEYSEYVNPASGQSGDNYMLHDPNVQAASPENQEAIKEQAGAAQESAAQDTAMEVTESAEEGTTEG